ncbi:MAG: LysR family transcriptional regulator [Methylococcaceae bacterium]|nr:LysR family transcriptional regulator [Methylococcaceae bacterium]MDP3902883.1 LysR family transcriptional regulator [Methylococcaceae bacterium]
MNVTIRQLQVFEMVARHLSFTRAAEELFLTQPAVSMQIKQIEEMVGLALFERLGRKIYLTQAGEHMYRVSREITNRLSEAERIFDEIKGPEGGRLLVSVASTVQYFAIRLLGGFCKQFPNVNVNLKVTNQKGLLGLLENNETDVVLMGEPPEGVGLVSEPLLDNPLVVIAHPEHHLKDRKAISLDELKTETFLMREQGSGTRTSAERFFAEKGMKIFANMELNNNGAIKLGVEEGLGLGIVSQHTIDNEVKAGRLIVLDVQYFPLVRKWYMVRREGKRLSAVGTAFEAFVRKEKLQYVRLP